MSENVKYCHMSEKDQESFIFDHVHIPWDRQINLHRQESWELAYIITGRGMRVIGDVIEPFQEGEVILIPPHIPHCWSFDEKVSDETGKIENICVFFTDRFLENSRAVFPELSDIVHSIQEFTEAVSYSGNILTEIQKLLKSMTGETRVDRLASAIRILGLLSDRQSTRVVGRPVAEDRKSKRMQLLHLYVMNNYQNTISLDEVARFVGMEKSSFCVFFRKATGKTFFSFLTEYRIEASCKMLANTAMSVSEVCHAAGFGDIPYYNRVFRRIKGQTPTQYRKDLQSG